MTIRFVFICFALFYFVLGDDGVGAVLGAGEAAIDTGGTLLDGLLQVPEASMNAGEAAGNAAIDWFGGTKGTAADSGTVPPATDGSVNAAENLRQNPDPAPGAAGPAVPVSAPIQPQKDGSNDNPDIEVDVIGEPESPKTAPDDDCDSENPKAGLPRIIWPLDRGNTAQNSNIQTALTQTMKNPRDVLVSEDDRGTIFWSAPLTDEQAEKLKATVEGIKDIVKDGVLVTSESPMATKLMQKRAEKVVIQDKAPPHLEYISTPPPASDSNPSYGYTSPTPPSLSNIPDSTGFRYAYLENAGENIVGYWIDEYSPVATNDVEFTTHNIIKGTIQALQPAGFEWNGVDDGFSNHMLGMISLIGGLQFGVAKKAELMLTQAALHYSSFIDALTKIRGSLIQRQEDWQEVRGYTVVGSGFTGPETADDTTKEEIKNLIQGLINDFQVVFVTPTGNGGPYGQVEEWPAIWASDDLPIIAVGGVDMENGKTSPRSRSGPTRTVSAPFWALSNRGALGIYYGYGTCTATALTMGVVMSYLSSSAVRDVLNLAENESPNPSASVAEKIRAYTIQMAYARPPGGARVIWNGLSSADPEYYHTVGDWTELRSGNRRGMAAEVDRERREGQMITQRNSMYSASIREGNFPERALDSGLKSMLKTTVEPDEEDVSGVYLVTGSFFG